jgi:hypothetical protein
MQHFANFGYVKQANKQLKKLNEFDHRPTKYSQDIAQLNSQFPEEKAGNLNYISKLMSGVQKDTRALRKRRVDPLSVPINSKKQIQYRGLEPNQATKNNWSEIRKTRDSATSDSGYLGFQNDPYKGLGGMMEEAIPREELSAINSYTSRLGGRWTK